MFAKINELLSMGPEALKAEWSKRRVVLLNDKIDYTAFLVWFIENFPQSANQAQNKPAADPFWQQFR